MEHLTTVSSLELLYAFGLDQEAQLLVTQWYNYEKTNGPTSMNLSQDFGLCLKLLISTLNH